MERLTEKRNGKNVIPLRMAVCGVDLPYWSITGDECDLERFVGGDAADRLAAYEDTGLEPEEVEHTKNALAGKSLAEIKEINGLSVQRMIELAQAEQEGRLVVLPCEVGDTVYTFYNGKNCKWPTNMKRRKIYETLVSGIRLHDWDADDWRLLLLFDTREASGCYEFSFSEVGKTVFLTRAEAEKAMEVSE